MSSIGQHLADFGACEELGELDRQSCSSLSFELTMMCFTPRNGLAGASAFSLITGSSATPTLSAPSAAW